MKVSAEDRADRLYRRQYGWPGDRKLLVWQMLALNIAMRDIRRALFRGIGGRGRPDLRPFWRRMERLGWAYLVVTVAVCLWVILR